MTVVLPGVLAASAAACVVVGLARRGTVETRLAASIHRAVPSVRWIERIGASRVLGRRSSPSLLGALAALGRSGDHERDRVVGQKALLACVVFLVGLASAVPIVAPLLGFAGWRLPDVWLSRLVRGHRRAVDREVPHLVDLLAAGSSAGLSAPAALREAAATLRGPLGVELRQVLRNVELGSRWRDELAGLNRRLGLPDIDRMVATLTRTDDLGVSLAEPLERLSSEVRASRRAAATERARKAPVKMLFPLVFLILPAFLLLTVVPVLISTIRSI